jgi:hypothetical protein
VDADQMARDRAAVLRVWPGAVCRWQRIFWGVLRISAIHEGPVQLSCWHDTEAAAWADAARRLTQGEG